MPAIAIIMPARYGSTRFPGKPLAQIGGQSMLSRVVDVAKKAAQSFKDDAININVIVTTEDTRIADHCKDIGVRCIITGDECRTGSDRALAAAKQLETCPDFIVNLQGDAPFTPPHIVAQIIQTFLDNPEQTRVVTPVHRLSWDALDDLRTAKKITPFSGTTAIVSESGHAQWFSKNIIPAIRKENKMREEGDPCPILQHIGLYGFAYKTLEKFCALPESLYEALEGLEQLRLLENNIPIKCVEVKIEGGLQSGIDSPEDLVRAEERLNAG